MSFDQLQTAYNVARSGQTGIIFFRDGLLKYTENTEKLCYYKLGDPLAKEGNSADNEALSRRWTDGG